MRKRRDQDTAHTFTERGVNTDAEAEAMEKRKNRKDGCAGGNLANYCRVAKRLGVDVKI